MTIALLSVADIADAVRDGLMREADRFDREQSPRGLDALDELGLHPLIAAAVAARDLDVAREVRYPTARGKRRETEGERCDIVLTPRGVPLRPTERRATLFDPPEQCDPEEAFWLEVKVVNQFTEEGPNGAYSSSLLSAVRQDVAKLAADDSIRRAALLILLFVRDERIAVHDLEIWEKACLEKSLPIGAPSQRGFAVTDRLGNAWCQVAVYPVIA